MLMRMEPAGRRALIGRKGDAARTARFDDALRPAVHLARHSTPEQAASCPFAGLARADHVGHAVPGDQATRPRPSAAVRPLPGAPAQPAAAAGTAPASSAAPGTAPPRTASTLPAATPSAEPAPRTPAPRPGPDPVAP